MKYKNIKSVGIELEGGGSIALFDSLEGKFQNLDISYDGSVRVNGCERGDREVKIWNENIGKVFEMVEYCYKNGFQQNDTCGNHVHIKVSNEIVGLLSTEDFFNRFIEWYKTCPNLKGKKFQNRLNCRWSTATWSLANVLEALSSNHKTSARYRAINCNAFPLYGTIEFRILPHFKKFSVYRKIVSLMLHAIDKIIEDMKNNTELSMSADITRNRFTRNRITVQEIQSPTVEVL